MGALKESISEYEAVESDTLSTAIAAFKDDGSMGRLDRDWMRNALGASGLRNAGGMTEYEDARFKEIWGDKELDDDETPHDPPGNSDNDDDNDGDDDNDHYPNVHRYENGFEDPHNAGNTGENGQTEPTQAETDVPSTTSLPASPELTEIHLRHVSRNQSMLWTSDLKIESLLTSPPQEWQMLPIIQAGDVIRLQNGEIFKEFTVRIMRHLFSSQRVD